jgi:adenylate cyclase
LLKRSPNNLFGHIGLIAACTASGREEEARHQAEKLLELDPAFSLDRFAEMSYIKDKADLERFIDDLRKAGLK